MPSSDVPIARPVAEIRLADDPWAVTPNERSGPGRPTAPWLVLAAAVLGGSGPAFRLAAQDGPGRLAGALVLVAAALGIAGGWHLAVRGGGDRRTTVTVIGGLGLAGAAAVGGGLSTVPSFGRAPILVTIVGVGVADAVLLGRAWARPHGSAAARPVLLALGPLVAAEVWWARSGPTLAVLGLLALAALITEAAARRPEAVRRADDGVAKAVRTAADAVGTAAVLIASLPTIYLWGGIGRVLRSLRPAPATRWVTRETTVPAALDDRPFGPTPRRDRRRRNLAGATFVVAVVAGTAVLVDERTAPPAPSAADDPMTQIDELAYSRRPGFASMPFADEMQRELLSIELVPDEATVYRTGDVSGRYVNVVDGERVTAVSTCDGCPTVDLWLLGGSVAFGVGQRDDHTVASRLVRAAAADGVDLRVRNLGVAGWTIWQEATGFERTLAAAERPPDLVVALDGFNDTVGTVAQSAVRGSIGDGPTTLDSDELAEFTRRRATAAEVGGGEVLGREAARRYRIQMARIERSAAGVDAGAHFFFQPDALADPTQRRGVDVVYRFDPTLFDRAEADLALETASAALRPDVVDLRHLLDGADEPLFGDVVHTNEVGAARIAEAIYRDVGDEIERSAARRSAGDGE